MYCRSLADRLILVVQDPDIDPEGRIQSIFTTLAPYSLRVEKRKDSITPCSESTACLAD